MENLQDYLYKFLIKNEKLTNEEREIIKSQIDKIVEDSKPLYKFTKALQEDDKKFNEFMKIFDSFIKGKL